MICNLLPVPENKFLISQSKDFVNSVQWDLSASNNMFKPKTNLPLSVRLQPGARVMFLNNSFIEHGICNPSDECARIAFSVRSSIVDIDVYKKPIILR
ncbi:hypothetical protein RclHR1_01230008 [Rhizophagus clarus]|uniref:Uncharacterized protein n=1 Tax=Rhizophagus clarus TaxID=94130 RepID=A0A2Z6Q8D4_9GLOM|nr:hypothetical protein RclHR1_01230008 [Rhizophagus clarus]GES99338.1 hypothetical protein RCL_jg9445.t1 [Rhizophagus clarus]